MKLSIALILLAVATGTAAAFTLSMSTSPQHEVSTALDRRSFIHATGLVTASTMAAPALADESNADFITTESGLKYKVTKEGDGAVPSPGMTVKAHYTGWLDDFDSIRKFDGSRERGRPITFKVGAGQVIRGWDEAFSTMKVGERRKLIIPARLAYGDRGAGGIIPGGATLYFDVELLGLL